MHQNQNELSSVPKQKHEKYKFRQQKVKLFLLLCPKKEISLETSFVSQQDFCCFFLGKTWKAVGLSQMARNLVSHFGQRPNKKTFHCIALIPILTWEEWFRIRDDGNSKSLENQENVFERVEKVSFVVKSQVKAKEANLRNCCRPLKIFFGFVYC